MKLGSSVVVECAFRFQILANNSGEESKCPDILVSLDEGGASMVLKPHHPESKYKKNLERLLSDPDFRAKLADNLYKKVSAALLPIEDIHETHVPNFDDDK